MTQPITKILIANRGEIACRVIRTCRRMGIATVAVYSDADRDALHVRMADETVHIGPAPAAESYLVIDKIVDAAKQSGADAVHPGYGFLSENPDFVRALDAAGITFIGPSASAIERMGLKDAAKDLMEVAGVPVTPGYRGENQDPDHLAKEAAKIGYPVLIKAVAGGGGKGMRKVEDAGDFKDALASCQREATASFGNAHVLIEKFITSPRHIEVQVFGDSHGHVVHMFERDCSLQRRHQKVIEEAPAPGMTEEVRAAMTSAAVKAAQAVNYEGAGTVEFIVDGSGALRVDGFWFMEMNTRLQVEHPVTEAITGLDLVEWQIRVARGETLPEQSEITMRGHAVEARLYAEDPANDFLPSPGRITAMSFLTHPDDDNVEVRIDSGVTENAVITTDYDPMIAKIIASGPSRDAVLAGLVEVLDHSDIFGLRSNIGFLSRILQLPAFADARLNTGLIGQSMSELAGTGDVPLRAYAAATRRWLDQSRNRERRAARLANRGVSPFADLGPWRLNGSASSRLLFDRDEQPLAVSVTAHDDSLTRIVIEGRTVSVGQGNWEDPILIEGREITVVSDGRRDTLQLWEPSASTATAPGALTAPMPGKVIAVNVAEGDSVSEGQTLLVLEAMKMEMAIKAPRDGVVEMVSVAAGAMVGDGDVMVALAETEAE